MSTVTTTPSISTSETEPTFFAAAASYLQARGVDLEIARRCGIRSIGPTMWQRLHDTRYPRLPVYPIEGLLVPYQARTTAEVDRPHIRIRPLTSYYYRGDDRVEIKGKWLSGDAITMPYIPSVMPTKGWETDASVPLFLAESAIKALSLVTAGYHAIGLEGVLAGYLDLDARRATGALEMHSELREINWRGRKTYISFDANLKWNPGVALGCARLAYVLRAAGADVRIVILPEEGDQDRSGPDDYLATMGREAYGVLVDAAVPAEPIARLSEKLAGVSGDSLARDVATEMLRDYSVTMALDLASELDRETWTAKAKIKKATLKAALADARRAMKPKLSEDETWKKKLLMTKNGQPASVLANVTTTLSHDPAWDGVLAFDEFSRNVRLTRPAPWSVDVESTARRTDIWGDVDDIRLVEYLSKTLEVHVDTRIASAAVQAVAEANSYHPVRRYLNGLRWDGVPRLETWLSCLGVEIRPYERLVGKWYLQQCVARIMEPGCQADYVLVLEGAQGAKKSTMIAALLPDLEWYSDSAVDLGSKDSMQAMQGVWVIELAEMASIMRTETHTAKAFFTSKSDRYRPPYGRRMVTVPRESCLIATINPEGPYLKDPTGNRRYWPIACNPTDDGIDRLRAMRDQLWAEALVSYREGARRYPDYEERVTLIEPEQRLRQIGGPWDAAIELGLEGKNETSVHEILSDIIVITVDKISQANMNEVARALTRLGWRQKVNKVRDESGARKSVRTYERIEPVEIKPSSPSPMDLRLEEI